MRHVDLDPVRAVIELLARSLARLHGTVYQLRSLGHHDLGRVTFQVVAAGGRNCARGHEQVRTGDVALIDRLPDTDVAISRALGLDVTDGRKTLLQGAGYGDVGIR